jgi:hypothetical protein
MASIIGALGVGAGATSTSKLDNGVDAYDPVQGTAALRPAPASASVDSSAPVPSGSLDGALETSLAAELGAATSRGGEPPIATAVPEPQVPARLPVLSRPPEALSRVVAPARVNAAGPNAVRANAPAGENASRLTIPADSPLLASTASPRSAAPSTLAAGPSSPSSNELPARDSTLFSDSPSF